MTETYPYGDFTATRPRRAMPDSDDDAPTLISASASYSHPPKAGLPTAREHLQDAEHWLEMAEREMRKEEGPGTVVRTYAMLAQTHAQLAGLAEAIEPELDPFWQDAEANAAVDAAIARGETPF